MKKTKYIILLISLSLLFPCTTYADCSNDELNFFKEHEEEYQVTYEYDKEIGSYDIVLSKPENSPFSYVIKTDYDYDATRRDATTIVCGKFSGGNYEIVLKGKTDECYETIKIFTIKLSKPNKYYGDPLCEGIEEFVLCKETYDKEIDYDTFVSRVEAYKSSKQEEIPNVTKKDDKFEEIKSYLEDNLLQIIVVAAFAITVIITAIVTIKRVKKSRRLE